MLFSSKYIEVVTLAYALFMFHIVKPGKEDQDKDTDVTNFSLLIQEYYV